MMPEKLGGSELERLAPLEVCFAMNQLAQHAHMDILLNLGMLPRRAPT